MREFDDDGQRTAYGRWWLDQKGAGLKGTPLARGQTALYEILHSAFEAGRQSVIEDMGDISRKLGEMADLTRKEQLKVAEQENSDEDVTQT